MQIWHVKHIDSCKIFVAFLGDVQEFCALSSHCGSAECARLFHSVHIGCICLLWGLGTRGGKASPSYTTLPCPNNLFLIPG